MFLKLNKLIPLQKKKWYLKINWPFEENDQEQKKNKCQITEEPNSFLTKYIYY